MSLRGTYARIYAVIRKIPKGRVATYGQVARLAGMPGHARQIGYALSALPEAQEVPWHRVINAQGEISARALPHFENEQYRLLKKERITFDQHRRIPLARYQWRPSTPAR